MRTYLPSPASPSTTNPPIHPFAPPVCAPCFSSTTSTTSGPSSPRRPYQFDAAMALEPVQQPGGEEEQSDFRGHISDQWSFGSAPNGGILTSLAISAARKAAGVTHRDPLSVSTHFVHKVHRLYLPWGCV